MKYFFIVICIFINTACNQGKTDSEINVTTDSTITTETIKEDGKVQTDTNNNNLGNGSTSYTNYLTDSFENYISNQFKEWILPESTAWETLWWNQYRTDSSLVGYIPADFNCDGKQDLAMILSNKKDSNTVAAWAFIASNNSFQPHKLYEYKRTNGFIPVGLQLRKPGNLRYLDSSGGGPHQMQLKCDAVQVLYFETAARTYYWKNGKFSYVQTGD